MTKLLVMAAMTDAQRSRLYRQRKREMKLRAVAPVSTLPPPQQDGPDGLQEAGRRLWDAVHEDYELSEHAAGLLLELCRLRDRSEAISAALAGAPLTSTNASGDVLANPLLAEARHTAALFGRLAGQLGLPLGRQDGPRPVRGSRRTHRAEPWPGA